MKSDIRKIWEKIASADEGTLTDLANKGTYKRACKDTDGLSPQFCEGEDSIAVTVGGETVTVVDDLTKCRCSCPSRAICRHILGGLIMLKSVVPKDITVEEKSEEAPPVSEATKEEAPEEAVSEAAEVTAKLLSYKDKCRVRECAKLCRGLLEEILTDGLMRISEDMPARLEGAAVRCHGVRAARAERAMRELGSRLTQHIERRAAFDGQMFAEKLCRCSRLLDELDKEVLTEDDLGKFRRSYEEIPQPMTLLPVGAREVTEGDYRGETYYFLDVDGVSGRQFLTFSDLRPIFYENSRQMRPTKAAPWDQAIPIDGLMKSKLVLKNAKISDGKLSSSGETKLISQTKMTLNCPEIYKLIISDFRQIAVELGKGSKDGLFFVHPDKCVMHRFDKYEQKYIMTIEDVNGCQITVSAKFKAETKDFVELLEMIGSKMVREPDRYFTLLVRAYMDNGELTLFPIEIYGHILPFEDNAYELPEEYKNFMQDEVYARRILELFSDLREMLYFIVHCGLRSDIRDEDRLVNTAENCGMENLTRLTKGLLGKAAAYRHDMRGDPREIMALMTALYDYIKTGERKLGTISALAEMSMNRIQEGAMI